VFLTIDGGKFQQHQNDAVAFSGDNAEISGQLCSPVARPSDTQSE
jgi:hypothetical protein